MKKRLPIVILVLAVLLGAGYWIDRARAAQQSQLSGYFESQPSLAASRIGGRVVKILVHEGDMVRAGQPIVQLETKSYAASYQAEKQGAEQAKQQLRETENGPRPEDIAKQRAAVDEAGHDYDRLVNGPLPEEIRQGLDKLREATQQYEKMKRGSRPEEIAAARAGANVALGKLQAAERGLTIEERAELKAQLDTAIAAEDLTQKELARTRVLYDQGATPKEQLDQAESSFGQAQGHRHDAEQAWLRGQRGTPAAELAQAREAYRQANAQFQLVLRGNRREDIEAARQEMLAAQESYRLLLKGSRPEDIAAAKARLDQQQAALTELLRGNRPEEIAKARAAAKQAERQAQSVQENLQENVVQAEKGALVERITVADGDLVPAGGAVAQLSDPTDIWLRVYLPEHELSKVKVGDSATLRIDGIDGDMSGYVDSIDSQGQFTPANLQSPDERGKQVFGIRIRLRSPDERVKAGMYVTVVKVGRWP